MEYKHYKYIISLLTEKINELDFNTMKSNFNYFFTESWKKIPMKENEIENQADKKVILNKIEERINKTNEQTNKLMASPATAKTRTQKKHSENVIQIDWSKRIKQYTGIAVAVAFIVGLTVFFTRPNDVQYLNITAQNDLKIQLPDSSTVLLYKGSHLKYANNFAKERSVILDGNAMFEVRKKLNKEFTVNLNSSLITVKGTSFIIKQDINKNADISLFEGCIEFKTKREGDVVRMNPSDHLIYNADLNKITVSKLAKMQWENGRMYFQDINLKDLISTINTLHNTSITISSNIKSNPLFTGSIKHSDSIHEIISKLCFTMNLNYNEIKNEFYIKKEN